MPKPIDFVNVALNTVTLGGHGRIKKAQSEYRTAYNSYVHTHQNATIKQELSKIELARLGQITRSSMKTLAIAYSITFQGSQSKNISDYVNAMASDLGSPRAAVLLSEYDSFISVAKGVGAATTAGVGSWTLVSLVGIASTGTPIITLSGVAATNAILACFGGGALAAGGAGMVGGMSVLSAIVAVPLILFSAWSSHSKASDIEAATETVLKEEKSLRNTTAQLDTNIATIRESKDKLESSHQRLHDSMVVTYRALFPYGLLSKAWRIIRYICRRGFYANEELPMILSLDEEIELFASQFCCSADRVIEKKRNPPYLSEVIVATVFILLLLLFTIKYIWLAAL